MRNDDHLRPPIPQRPVPLLKITHLISQPEIRLSDRNSPNESMTTRKLLSKRRDIINLSIEELS